MKVLCIGAHPADAFDQAGGTLANFANDGHEVYIAVVTHGAYSHAQLVSGKGTSHSLDDVIALKKKECDAAARFTGAKEVRYLGFDDEPFIVTARRRSFWVNMSARFARKLCSRIILGNTATPTIPSLEKCRCGL